MAVLLVAVLLAAAPPAAQHCLWRPVPHPGVGPSGAAGPQLPSPAWLLLLGCGVGELCLLCLQAHLAATLARMEARCSLFAALDAS